MAGRIRDEDVAAVRDRAAIAEVIGEHVQLRNAGGGNLKGICPFHDEKSPSLSVSPSRNLFHCFGCGAGGDVIRFVERIEHLSFSEAVENLAGRLGIQLRYAEGGTAGNRPAGQRARLVEAHVLAAEFYAGQLATPDAAPARSYLDQRGFDAAVAKRFGCGYAPGGWDGLTKYLLSRGFSPAELNLAGLARESGRGSLIDRFHRRLLWPIKDVQGDVVGFGARRIHDDDKIEAKYLNTPETPLYKKSQLLYGMDVAKREIGKQHQAVIVEGYTDVMACHLAGVTTAVATCGTAFGNEHINVIRRLWSTNSAEEAQATTKVIFTFDGDAAGMKAAERAFKDDQKFLAETYVAIEPTGKDPCELRQSGGDVAVRALIEARIPMLRYMLRTLTSRYDLDTVEGRAAALNLTVPLVAQIRDPGSQTDYARELAGLAGLPDPNEVLRRVRGLVRSGERSERPAVASTAPQADGGVPARVGATEREVIKAALQLPEAVGKQFDELGPGAFLVAVHQQLQAAIAGAGGATGAQAGPGWPAAVAEQLPAESQARHAVNGLAVEPLRAKPDRMAGYAAAMVASLANMVIEREIGRLKGLLQRADSNGERDEVERLHPRLIELELKQRELQQRAIGGEA